MLRAAFLAFRAVENRLSRFVCPHTRGRWPVSPLCRGSAPVQMRPAPPRLFAPLLALADYKARPSQVCESMCMFFVRMHSSLVLPGPCEGRQNYLHCIRHDPGEGVGPEKWRLTALLCIWLSIRIGVLDLGCLSKHPGATSREREPGVPAAVPPRSVPEGVGKRAGPQCAHVLAWGGWRAPGTTALH